MSFGLNGGAGYGEFDVVLDGTGGKPTVAQFTTGTHHVIVQYDAISGLQQMFYDGNLIDSRIFQAGTNIISGGGANGFIGSNGGTEGWNGIIDEMALYDAPLTLQEIAMHSFNVQNGLNYFAPAPAPEPGTGILMTLAVGLLSLKRRRKVRVNA